VVVLIALATLWAVSGEMSHFSALETWSMFIGTRVLFIHHGVFDELYCGMLFQLDGHGVFCPYGCGVFCPCGHGLFHCGHC